MKKLLLLTLFTVFSLVSRAQHFTLTMIHPPCDSDGIVVATLDSALVGTLELFMPMESYIVWNCSAGGIDYNPGQSTHILSSGAVTDTFYEYSGGLMYAMIPTDCAPCLGPIDSIIRNLPFEVTDSGNTVVCPVQGQLGATISGGIGPFSVKWLVQYDTVVFGGPEVAYTYASIGNPAIVPNGTYVVRVTDSSTGCVAGGGNSPVRVSITPDFTDSIAIVPSFCPAIGSATAVITGGTAPFIHTWTNAVTGLIAGTADTLNLAAGLYWEQTIDLLGCVALDTFTIPYVPDFTASVTTTNASCRNGTAVVAISGGTAPFSYLWSTGATTDSISGLIVGTYNLKVTDALGCADSSGIDPALTGSVAQAITISVPIVVTPATCVATDGSLTAFGSGGAPPYTFLWSNGGTTQTIAGLASAYYDVTATDANGCIGHGYNSIYSSTPITVTYTTTASSCTSPTGTATLTVGGGTGPYTITWYTTPVQTGTTATGLSAGNYYFQLTDSAGCTQSGVVTVPPADVIALSFTSLSATCTASDGAVYVLASGGVAPYSYSWSTGSSATATLAAVPYGNYTATVTDTNGCSASSCQHVPYTSPLELGLSSTDASCLYNNDGAITAVAAMGTPPYTYSPGGASSGAVTASGLGTGPYWVTVTDAAGCSAWDYTYVGYNVYDSSCFCTVSGTVYNDTNHNCIQDPGEAGIENIQIQTSGFEYTYTDPVGHYYFLLPSGTYSVSQTILDMYPLSPCQPNNISYTSVAGTGCYATINFADTAAPIHDMQISTWDYMGAPRPGFSYTQVAVVSNNGTQTEPNIFTSYTPDGQLYSPAFVPYGVLTGAPYYYSTPDSALSLAPGASQQFLISYSVPADIPLGTNVIFKDSVACAPPVANWLLDYSPWNNVNYFTTTTIGSFDPNFKEVSPKGTGPAGTITLSDSVLQYMVHFQNTGSYMAENIVVKDTLDASLDWNTLRPVYSSDQCVVDVSVNGVATFSFINIDLPPSSSEPITSNAMFTYTIKQRHALRGGTQIKNKGWIYFDFNAPVVTNTTLNTIFDSSATSSVTAVSGNQASFNIFPNPAQNTFTAELNLNTEGIYSLKVCDVTGKITISKTLSLTKGSQNIIVDASILVPGIYFVTFTGSDNISQTQKLVIMK